MDEAAVGEGGEVRAEDAEEGGVGGAGVEEEGELELSELARGGKGGGGEGKGDRGWVVYFWDGERGERREDREWSEKENNFKHRLEPQIP